MVRGILLSFCLSFLLIGCIQSTPNQTDSYKAYYNNGNVRVEWSSLNGKVHGKTKHYFPSGELQYEGNFLHGNRDGKYIQYYKNSNVKSQMYYKEGQLVKAVTYDKKGGVVSEFVY